ncbi:Inner membrane protein YhaI [compost metagenome]
MALGLGYGLLMLYGLGTMVPSLAVSVRRMHDIGKSGWTIFVAMIPLVGPIWILVLFFTEGDRGENYYGTDPKNEIEEINEIGNVELQ